MALSPGRQPVHFRMAAVAFYPRPFYLVAQRQSVQALPQVLVFYGRLDAVRQPRRFQSPIHCMMPFFT